MCILKNIDRKPYRANENGNQSTVPLFKISGFLIQSVLLRNISDYIQTKPNARSLWYHIVKQGPSGIVSPEWNCIRDID